MHILSKTHVLGEAMLYFELFSARTTDHTIQWKPTPRSRVHTVITGKKRVTLGLNLCCWTYSVSECTHFCYVGHKGHVGHQIYTKKQTSFDKK